jgi:hypothetical protein
VRRGAERGWDRCTSNERDEGLTPTDAAAIARLWQYACAEETLPAALGLRYAPVTYGMYLEAWREALAGAIRKATSGVVIVVTVEPWALARLLPGRVGETC